MIVNDELCMQLTPIQQEHVGSVRWLVSSGGLCTGKTHLMCVAFLMEAFDNLDTWIYPYDHQVYHSKDFMVKRITNIFYGLGDERLDYRIHPKVNAFKVVRETNYG